MGEASRPSEGLTSETDLSDDVSRPVKIWGEHSRPGDCVCEGVVAEGVWESGRGEGHTDHGEGLRCDPKEKVHCCLPLKNTESSKHSPKQSEHSSCGPSFCGWPPSRTCRPCQAPASQHVLEKSVWAPPTWKALCCRANLPRSCRDRREYRRPPRLPVPVVPQCPQPEAGLPAASIHKAQVS